MTDLVFFDGHCGLCHGAVRFLLARDPEGIRFRFAPLQGRTLQDRLPESVRRTLPDSLVVLGEAGELRVRSGAVAHVLGRLSWPWRGVGRLLSVLPRPLADWGYDGVAALRARLFTPPSELCPRIPSSLRDRFLP